MSNLKSIFSSDGFKEIGKGIIAFANILTALVIVNIIYHNDDALIFALMSVVIYVSLYYLGYKFIKKGDDYV
ncbi:hypothetical protein JHD48_10200 [Sulfurimonas sp. SAG-AH-194-I05]|nr:hypothetical protein [Sulfurimonas sp. SAG-AH-194-I05]MDF1876104.1 hypothetical protein [Sulfurimonas sp. SAG-AH-194-I05]